MLGAGCCGFSTVFCGYGAALGTLLVTVNCYITNCVGISLVLNLELVSHYITLVSGVILYVDCSITLNTLKAPILIISLRIGGIYIT